ncbi:MAG TPA: hypothetical protein ENI68_11310 [Gammaproteobacteria bacterium]|nr:hypothetical protein [Gammaproteobacteria bacterium]
MIPVVADPYLMASELVQLLTYLAVLLMMLGGLCLTMSFIPKRVGGHLIFYGVISAVIGTLGPGPLVALYKYAMGLPWWVLVIVGGLLVLSALQVFVALFLGKAAAATFAGSLAASLFKMIFWVLLAPFRGLRRLFRGPDE